VGPFSFKMTDNPGEDRAVLGEAVAGDDQTGEDEEESLAIVPTNASAPGTLLVQENHTGEVGIEVIGDSEWYLKKVDEAHDIIYECARGGKAPTFIAVKDYAAAKGKALGSQLGDSTGELTAGAIDGFVKAHVPFLVCVPVFKEIMEIGLKTLPRAFVSESITQSLAFVIDVGCAGLEPVQTAINYVELNAISPISKTAAFFALIESDTHFQYPLHTQYLGRAAANIYNAVYEDFWKKFVAGIVKSLPKDADVSAGILDFVDTYKNDPFAAVQDKFRSLMQMSPEQMVEGFKKFIEGMCEWLVDKAKKTYADLQDKVIETGTEITDEVRAALKTLPTFDWDKIGKKFSNVKGLIKNSLQNVCAKMEEQNAKDLEESVKYYKLKWKIELAYYFFAPMFSLRGDLGLSVFEVEGDKVKTVKRTDHDKFIGNCVEIAKGELSGNPEKPTDPNEPKPTPLPPEGGGDGDGDTGGDGGLPSRPPTLPSLPPRGDKLPKEVEGCVQLFNLGHVQKMVEKFSPASKSQSGMQIEQQAMKTNISRGKILSSAAPQFSQSPLFREIDQFLNVQCAQVIGPFLSLVSQMSGVTNFDELQTIQFANTPYTEVRQAVVRLGNSNGYDWRLLVNIIQEVGVTFCITRNGSNVFDLPSIRNIFEMLGGAVEFSDIGSLISSIPDPILDIGNGLSVSGVSFLWPFGTNPSIRCGLNFDFEKDSPFARNLGLKAIYQSIQIKFLPGGLVFNTRFDLSIGEIKLVGVAPASKDDPFVLALDTPEPVALCDLVSSIPGIGDLTNTGLDKLASEDAKVEFLEIGLGRGGVEFFNLSVASNLAPQLGRVKAVDPSTSLNLISPFTRNRSVSLFYGLSLEVDNFEHSFELSGGLTYESRDISGVVNGTMNGRLGLTDIFDIDSNDMPPDLEITEDMKISFDLTQVKIDEPSISLAFGDDKILTFASSTFSVAVGGPEQLALNFSFPTAVATNGLLDAVQLEYKKRVDGQRKPWSKVTAIIPTKGNVIEDGLKLVDGGFGQAIINLGEVQVEAEKKGRKVNFLMPSSLLPQSITFGSEEEGLTLSNAKGFITPGKGRALEFGVGGQLEFNILGLSSFMLGGELSVGRRGFTGLMQYEGDMKIGKHVILHSLGVIFEVIGTMPQAGATTTFSLYGEDGEFQFTMSMVGSVPYPSSFNLSYPGEMSISGVVDAFLGDKVRVPDAIGKIIVLTGTFNPDTSEYSSLQLYFDIAAIEFAIDCHVKVFNGFFEGAIKGSFSMGSGFYLDAWLKPIDLAVLKISGADGKDSNAEMRIKIPPPTGGELDIYVNGSVTVLGIERTALIMVKSEGTIYFRITGDMWNVLSAQLTVEGDVSNGEGFLEVEAIFENTIIETITENSHALVNNLVDGAREGLNSAIEDLQEKRRQLDSLNDERKALIELVERQQAALVEKIRGAQAKVQRWQSEVESLDQTIEANKAIVKKERDDIIDRLEAAQRSLDEAKVSLKRIDREIESRRIEAERKIQNLNSEIKRFEKNVADAEATVREWRSSLQWFTDEIRRFERRIDDRHAAINRLRWWSAWKAAGYWAQIAAYRVSIGGLWVGRGAADVSLRAAELVLKGVELTLDGLKTTLENLPAEAADPVILALQAERGIASAAIDVAKQILKGAAAVVEWAPLELDPRVAPIILLKETATLALAGAKEAVKLLGDVVEDFNPALDPRVITHDASILFQKGLIDVATVFLEGVKDTVTGPISNVLSFIAEGVNEILNSIPLVINGVYFKSTLSTASTSGVNLKIDYTFLGNKHEFEFAFNFSIRGPLDVIRDFCKEIANNILGLSTSTRIGTQGADHNFSFEELENAQLMVEELGEELAKETEQVELDYEYSQVALKRQLFISEESTLQLRGDLLTEHSFTAQEEKVVLSNIENTISTSEEEGSFGVFSGDASSRYGNAVSTIKSLLEDLEGKATAQQEQLVKYSTTLQAAKEKLIDEQKQEMSRLTSLSTANLSTEEILMQENDIKRETIEQFKRHERVLASVIEKDREEEQRIISERKQIYDKTLVQMQTLSELSNYFVNEIESLTQKQIATAASMTSANISDVDDDVELTERDEMILKMAMYQVNLSSANESIQKRALYDKCLFEISTIEGSIPDVLGLMRDGGVMSPPSRQQ